MNHIDEIIETIRSKLRSRVEVDSRGKIFSGGDSPYLDLILEIAPGTAVGFEHGASDALGIVGESGCGKSVTAQSVLRLVPQPPGRIEHGRILFDGIDLLAIPMERMRNIRGNRISMIFQEPMTSLNPKIERRI